MYPMRKPSNSFLATFIRFLALGILLFGLVSSVIKVEHRPYFFDLFNSVRLEQPASATTTTNREGTATGKITVSYSPVTKPFYKTLETAYQQSELFEKLSAGLSETFALPQDISVEMKECGFINAFYEPRYHRITMCYDLTENLIQVFKQNGASNKQASEKAIYAATWIFFHETAHMLIGELEIPVVGREEDAADQFATLLWLKADNVGYRAVLAAADWFRLVSSERTTPIQYMGEHSLSLQRFYAQVCLLYGEQPKKYADFVKKLGFTRTRLQKCRSEFAQIKRSWNTLLEPHMKVEAKL